ncbi:MULTISPECIES: hypothetical protein [Enterobacter]|uniref:hypothetical protein n=1 Tax=Enterobacter TaxID=547 RepID=UPI001CEFAC6F|nr:MULTISPECIES: hypothetical protein [Enterobacter]MDA4840813.1 hypothetical protein [Enterobacter hormaechei]WGG63947.1 hypothetical protein QCL67_15435 [Enterobacter ludwigii]WGG66656.1 hypothetical protein QCL67_04605 [Enterobacter ludwigii]
MKNTTISNETTEQNGKQKAIPFVEEANLRDYFAAKAVGLCFAQYINHAEVEGFQDGWRDGVAADAYLMADAMLKAREAS